MKLLNCKQLKQTVLSFPKFAHSIIWLESEKQALSIEEQLNLSYETVKEQFYF